MALAPFFSRTYSAVGAHLGITREQMEKVLSGRIVGIKLGSACSNDGNEKWIAELLVNLLARLYPVLSLSGDDAACSALSKIGTAINPNIEIKCCPADATVIVCIGAVADNEREFMAGASGWVASIGTTGNDLIVGPANPYSAGAAAALAAWRVFQAIFIHTQSSVFSNISLSLLDYGPDAGKLENLPSINLGEVAVAGIGAVGNPAIWAWARHENLSGNLHLIDPQYVDLSNLQRYCLTSYEDIGKEKVHLAQRELKNSSLLTTSWACFLEDFADKYRKIDTLPAICVSVDNVDGRRAAQALLPRLVINGWTSDSGLGASRHRFGGDGACLGCFYHPKGVGLSQTELAAKSLGLSDGETAELWVKEQPLCSEQIQKIETHLRLKAEQLTEWVGKRIQDVYSGVICGQVGVDLPIIDRIATVPLAHQSVFAGILMAVELVKHSSLELEARSQPAPLIIWDDIKRTPPKYWTAMRAKHPECFCSDVVYQQIYTEKWGGVGSRQPDSE